MDISSRTPEGSPNLCPVCGAQIKIEPFNPAGDAPCPHCGHLLWFQWKDLGETEVIKPTRVRLRPEDWDRLLANVPIKRGVQLVLDFSEVKYLTSVGKLILLKKKVAADGGKLKIENVQPNLLEIFRTTRLDRVFDVSGRSQD